MRGYFHSQMETVLIFLQIFFATQIVLKSGEYLVYVTHLDHLCQQKYWMGYKICIFLLFKCKPLFNCKVLLFQALISLRNKDTRVLP